MSVSTLAVGVNTNMSNNIPDSTNLIMHNLEETHMEENEEIATNTSQKVCGDGAHDDIEQGADQENNVEFQKPKRQKTSKVWSEFKEVKDDDGTRKIQCIHCRGLFVTLKTTPTTQFHRHLKSCGPYLRAKLAKDKENLTQIQLAFVTKNVDPTSYSAFTDGKFDMEKMKEFAAQWILIDEHPFSIIEEDGLNFMLKRGMPDWIGFSRVTTKKYCVESKNQRIEYMVIIGHWIDQNWVLQKRVLNFVHLPPPRRGIEIENTLWECLAEWGIQNKVYSISVDNASANDATIANLRIFVRNVNKLLCGGALFHVSVEYVRRSDARLKIFTEIVKQLNIPERKLVDDCRTRWNSTYEMLATTIKFKDVFPRFSDPDQHYQIGPTDEDWEKVEKVISVLEVAGEISKVRTTLYALNSKYIYLYNGEVGSSGNTQLISLSSQRTNSSESTKCGWSEYAEYVRHLCDG
ncbi:hypothetical protein BUALT_BualtUnG0003500 [Buddleja alternifolia]|uniref:BED-type domain-containing protein n=1 Tax=Buddleja alternifolia TaxID=168488 RepID=A0AAV6W5V7_9LAMI|nr:hypothetical protein BUALT_BualtUnG0003500 [Buddleja alternifolia]